MNVLVGNPKCRQCGKEVCLMRDRDDMARWWCKDHGFRKLHDLIFDGEVKQK